MSSDANHSGSDDRDADFSKLEESADSESFADDNDDEQQLDRKGRKLLKKLEKKLSESEQRAAETEDKYLRSLAEFENYKKRVLRERSDLLKYQGEQILFDLVQVLDNIELALQHAEAEPAKLRDGVELIYKMFVDTLSKWQVQGESGLGKPFDPNKFQAISRMPAQDAEPGTIISELKKAYFYKDKLLRAGEVVVAEVLEDQSPESSSADDSSEASDDTE